MTSLWSGIRHFKEGQYEQALPLLVEASPDSMEACLLLSRMYFAGNGVEKSRVQYAFWLCRAAQLGDPAARSKIKRMLRAGDLPDELMADPFVLRLKSAGPKS